MVGVAAHLFQVVVLAAHADALLGVHGAPVGARAGAQEHVLELVHAGIGEQQRGIVGRHHRRARHQRVLALHEVVEEVLADLARVLSVLVNIALNGRHPTRLPRSTSPGPTATQPEWPDGGPRAARAGQDPRRCAGCAAGSGLFVAAGYGAGWGHAAARIGCDNGGRGRRAGVQPSRGWKSSCSASRAADCSCSTRPPCRWPC